MEHMLQKLLDLTTEVVGPLNANSTGTGEQTFAGQAVPGKVAQNR
jgi:hypothetical protein